MRCPAFLAPALSLLLAGCIGFAETETQTFTLRPDRMQVADLLHENRSGVCAGVPRHGTASRLFEEWQEDLPADADPKLLVGYSSVLLRGESCDTWLHHVFQGLMDFDLRGLPERGAITDATLRYDSSTFLPDGSTAAGYDTTCLYEVGEVTEEWRTRALSAAGSPDIFRGSREDLIAARPISVEGARAARTAVDVTAADTGLRLHAPRGGPLRRADAPVRAARDPHPPRRDDAGAGGRLTAAPGEQVGKGSEKTA